MKANEISMMEKSIEKTITMKNLYTVRMKNNLVVNTWNLLYAKEML